MEWLKKDSLLLHLRTLERAFEELVANGKVDGGQIQSLIGNLTGETCCVQYRVGRTVECADAAGQIVFVGADGVGGRLEIGNEVHIAHLLCAHTEVGHFYLANGIVI